MRTRILLKITGAALSDTRGALCTSTLHMIACQIKNLAATHHFGIVVGGGNIVRGNALVKTAGISPLSAHSAGMVATIFNGLIIQAVFEQEGVACRLLSAISCPALAPLITPDTVHDTIAAGSVPIFVAGTGNPFFTTDTTAIIRALQMNACQVWKGTHVDGVYSRDPRTDPTANKLSQLSYAHALEHNLGIMDKSAYILAQEHQITTYVFNIFEPTILEQVAQGSNPGTRIT